MNDELKIHFNKLLDKAKKPHKCICGEQYKTAMGVEGTFVYENSIPIWCCCNRCAKDMLK